MIATARGDLDEERSAILHRADALLSQFDEVWPHGREYLARCPFHADKTPSLSIYAHPNDGEWMWRCFPCGKGGDVFTLLRLKGTCFRDAMKLLGGELAVRYSREPRPDRRAYGQKGAPRGIVVREYDYCDEQGVLLYQVVRMEPKDFRQRRPDGNGGWTWRLGNVRRVIYRLPDLMARPREPVFVVEGEKDADRLAAAGLVATTSCGGAGSWRRPYGESLRGRDVRVIADNDEAGAKHARQVLTSLGGIARSTRELCLAGLPPKGDVSDWLDAGHSAEELLYL